MTHRAGVLPSFLQLVLPAVVGVTLRFQQDAAACIRTERASRAAAEEQLRIVQELHDTVGHGLAVITTNAQTPAPVAVLARARDKPMERSSIGSR